MDGEVGMDRWMDGWMDGWMALTSLTWKTLKNQLPSIFVDFTISGL